MIGIASFLFSEGTLRSVVYRRKNLLKAKLYLAFHLVGAFVFNSPFTSIKPLTKNVSPKRRTPSLETVETWIALTLSALTTATTAIDVTVN